jgi:hypothetical protein
MISQSTRRPVTVTNTPGRPVGVGERRVVVVGGAGIEQHQVAGPDFDPADLEVLAGM